MALSNARVALLVLSSLIVSSPARADWPAGGLPVCDQAASQLAPAIAGDGSGGAYIAWIDERSPETGIYVQRVTAAGEIAEGWPVNGWFISATHLSMGSPSIASAPDGAYVAWGGDVQAGGFGVLLQRVLSRAAIAPGWPHGGKVIASTGAIRLPRVVADGSGGAIVAWNDPPNIFVQRVGSGGSKWPLWPVNGTAATIGGGAFEQVWMAADGLGGAFVAWAETVGVSTNLFAQHVDENGAIDGGWPADGKRIGPLAGEQRAATLAGDGAGAAIVAWQDSRDAAATGRDIYAQRLTASGASTPGWPADGLALCSAAGDQTAPRVAADGAGGALVAWFDRRGDFAGDAYATRVTREGTIAAGWPPDGAAVCVTTGEQLVTLDAVVPDDTGGGYFFWQDGRAAAAGSRRDVYAQRLRGDGSPAPGWPAQGVALGFGNPDQSVPTGVANGSGGAIVAWSQGHWSQDPWWNVFSGDIHAGRINADGSTPALVALVSARVDADGVRLEWHSPDRRSSSFEVQRRTPTSSWSSLGWTVADGFGRVSFEDRDVIPGGRHGYRLGDGTGTVLTTETWVDVPAAGFAIRGVSLDADADRARVRLSLHDSGPARIELFDARGGRRVSRDLSSSGAGDQTIEIAVADQPQGVYLLRLTQASRSVRRKFALIR